jgi:hypothetical protein
MNMVSEGKKVLWDEVDGSELISVLSFDVDDGEVKTPEGERKGLCSTPHISVALYMGKSAEPTTGRRFRHLERNPIIRLLSPRSTSDPT